MQSLLAPYLANPTPELLTQLAAYLDLLTKWNARTNLTAVRDPDEIVTRHFGESLFAAQILSPHLPNGANLLDFGSGAGFPGLPIQLYRPDLQVTLAESQNKKATFLREVTRTLGLKTAIHADRVEILPESQKFACITLRAVDNTPAAIAAALPRLAPAGIMALLSTPNQEPPQGLTLLSTTPMPQTTHSEVALYQSPA